MSLEDLKLDSEPNIELMEIIPIKEGLEAEDEIASQVFLIARNLKRNKHTKQLDTKAPSQEKTDSTVEQSAQYAKNVTFLLKIRHHRLLYREEVIFDVDLNQTLRELTIQVLPRFKVR